MGKCAVKKRQYTKENNQSMGDPGFVFSLHRPVSGFGLQASWGGRPLAFIFSFTFYIFLLFSLDREDNLQKAYAPYIARRTGLAAHVDTAAAKSG
jgi:hypothetical protein